ncbi:MAG: SH3 domain-containing protein [Lachnotalea sp.]
MKLNLETMKAFLIKNKTYVIIAAVFIAMVFVLMTINQGDSSTDAKQADSDEVITVDETTPDTATEDTTVATNDLQVDAYPAVNELVNKYFTAMSTSDIDTLLQIVNPLSDEEQTQIQQKKEYIEGYDNITCYTKIGPEENSYVVFVYYEIKFININTLVPGEIPLYICSNEDGSLYIYNDELTPEVDSYIADIAAGQDIVELIGSVDTKFTEAQAADPDLKAFIDKLSGTADQAAADQAAADQAAADQAAADQAAADQATADQAAADQAAADQAAADQAAADQATTEDGYEAVDETVYASETVNVRDSSSEDGSKLGQIYVGESTKRTGVGSNGWSRIEFNGETGYVMTEYLTTEGVTQEIKYLSSTVNLRAEADENSDKVATAYEGTKVTRSAKLDNGWSRISFDGVTGYVKSEYLADTYK